MALSQVASGTKEKEPCHLHQHAHSSDPEVNCSGTYEHQASNERCPVLLDYKIVRISSETLAQLRELINNAVRSIDEMMLQNVWNEMNFRLDMPCHPRGTHRTFIEFVEKTWLMYGYFDVSTIVVSVILWKIELTI